MSREDPTNLRPPGGASAALAACAALAAAGPAAAAPLSILESFGARAHPVAELTWGLLALAVFVTALISALLLIAMARPGEPESEGSPWPDARSGSGRALRWIYAGLALTVIALIGCGAWTLQVLGALRPPEAGPAVVVAVTGHQWWWEVEYRAADGLPAVETANEIHVPAGRPVRIELRSADVIHSFWVPALAGKTDAIPGQLNVAWLEADAPGVFAGVCAEYCGLQHAHMALRVVARTPEGYADWRRAQAAAAPPPPDARAQEGRALFLQRCAACHAVRGTPAQGEVGPDLSHLMSRPMLAAGAAVNDAAHLAAWIHDPDALKPGARMPAAGLDGAELAALRDWLLTLE